MPYRQAPYAVAILLAFTVLAFWPGYYGVLRTAPLAFHVHGISATIWIVLLGAQSWTIHNRRFALHALAGRLSVVYFPLLVAGMAGVLHSMSAATPTDPFYIVNGAGLGMLDVVAAGMVSWLFSQALASRRDRQLHPRYMMATVLFLLAPVFGRLAGGFLPPLRIHGPDEFWKFGWAGQVGNLIALVTAVYLYRQAPRHGWPFVVSGIAILCQMALFPLLQDNPAWKAVFLAIGAAPLVPVLAVGAAIGALAAWRGWTAVPARGAGARISPA